MNEFNVTEDYCDFEQELTNSGLNNPADPKYQSGVKSMHTTNPQVSPLGEEYNNPIQDVTSTLDCALHYYHKAKLCIIPCVDKAPDKSCTGWTKLSHPQHMVEGKHELTEFDIKQVYFRNNDRDIGVVLGYASGNLVCFDFETAKAYEDMKQKVKDHSIESLVDASPATISKNGGAHLFVYMKDKESVPLKIKLSKAKDKVAGKDSDTLCEMLAEGQQAVIPTPPRLTSRAEGEKKRIYLKTFPTSEQDTVLWTKEDLELMVKIIRECSEVPMPNDPILYAVNKHTKSKTSHQKECSPTTACKTTIDGNASIYVKFNCDAENQKLAFDLLLEHGWEVDSRVGEQVRLTRPGKNKGTSATWNARHHPEHSYPYFHVFTEENTALDGRPEYVSFKEGNYDPWNVVMKLKYKGDEQAMKNEVGAKYNKDQALAQNIDKALNMDTSYQPECVPKESETAPIKETVSPEVISKFKTSVNKFNNSDKHVGDDKGSTQLLCKIAIERGIDFETAYPIIDARQRVYNENKCVWDRDNIKSLWDRILANPQAYNCVPNKDKKEQPQFTLITGRLSECKMRARRWVVKDMHGKGLLPAALSILIGQSGLGKSTFTRYLAACITVGGGQNSFKVEQGEVLLLCFEDDLDEDILPHIIACGGDPTKIHFLKGQEDENGKLEPWNATHMPALHRYLESNPNIKLVVADVLTTLTSETKASSNDADQTRAILQPLNKVGQDYGVAVLVLHHPNKHGTTARNSVSGSSQINACARIVWQLSQDSEQQDVRYLSKIKGNINGFSDGVSFRDRQVDRSFVEAHAAKYGISVDYEIEDEYFRTIDILDIKVPSADEAFNAQISPSAVDKCVEWLVERLKDGEPVLSSTVLEECMQAGHSKATFHRARGSLKPALKNIGPTDGKWFIAYNDKRRV